jgi:hypothetical protein
MQRRYVTRAGKAMFLALLLSGLAPAFAAQGSRAVDVGDRVSYEFRRPLVNGLGLRSLDELRGTPVFIEFWGTR